ncbi:hypothetical protein ARMSODRAFT_952263 [Armillaria solidipes]|uniref:Uncharacterized protein n=1 Tax=Armillaria solidipes TaxID=1076256 RepID=A0A2H3C900_9AGAR|nr:hypothetical protein ARMSODRAFT_952263 [Armillaria solidipes]
MDKLVGFVLRSHTSPRPEAHPDLSAMDKLVGFVLSVSRVTLSLEPFLVLGILAILFRHFLICRRQCPSCKLDRNLDDYYQISYATDFSIPVNLNPFISDNMFPASATRIEIEKSLKRLETNAACFEKILKHQQNAISQVALILKRYEEAYAKTRSEQHHMEEILGRHRSALSSPIRSLPDDLLVVIFQFTSPNAACNDQFPWIATGVCRRWRAVAHSSRILWSQFSIDPFVEDPPPHRLPQTSIFAYYGNAWASSHVAPEVETKRKGAVGRTFTKSIINKALEYSRGSPLTVSFDSSKAKGDMRKVAVEWFDIFINLASRWKHVTLAIESPLIEKLPLIMGRLSMLETLDFSLRDDYDLPPFATEIFRLAPRLRKVVCRSSSAEFIFPWKQLQQFSVLAFPLSWDYYHQILCSGSNLEMLDLQAGWGKFDTLGRRPGDNTDPATTLPYLRVLKICSELNTLLDSVVLPRLTTVTIRGLDEDNITSRLSSLIERSACALRSLSFTYVNYSADFTQLLRACSSLTSLSIVNYEGQALFDVMARSSSILPSLESFIIGNASNTNTNTITYDYVISIIEMLEARRSCLKEFSISIWFKASGSEEIQENSTTPSTAGGVATLLSPSDRLRLETLAGVGMKIHIDSLYLSRDRWSGTVIPCVSLGAGVQS